MVVLASIPRLIRKTSHEEAPQQESVGGEGDKGETSSKQKSSWKMGIHHASPKEGRPS